MLHSAFTRASESSLTLTAADLYSGSTDGFERNIGARFVGGGTLTVFTVTTVFADAVPPAPLQEML